MLGFRKPKARRQPPAVDTAEPQASAPELPALNATTFLERRTQTFSNINLTLISIVQGVALYTLTAETVGYINASGGHPEVWGWQVPFIVTSFILICIATFEYTWFVAVFQWPPTVFDIAIPLGLGFFEILPMYYFRSPAAWGFCSALMCAAGGIAYGYSLLRLPGAKIQETHPLDVRSTIQWYYVKNIVACAVGCSFLLIVTRFMPGDVWSWLNIDPHNQELLECAVFFALELFVLLRSEPLLRRVGDMLRRLPKVTE